MIRISDIGPTRDPNKVCVEYSLSPAREHTPRWKRAELYRGITIAELEWVLRNEWGKETER